MLDVALALEYLHRGQSKPVMQCDLKPSNVLLDDQMVAHVGDFVIAKTLAGNKTVTKTKTLGTLSYITPSKTFQAIDNFSSMFFFLLLKINITKLIKYTTKYP